MVHTNALELQLEEELKNKFYNLYNTKDIKIFTAPARINLIGEHIDYNGGHVLPAAVSLYCRCLVSFREDLEIQLYSTSFENLESFDLNKFEKSKDSSWVNYIKGVISVLRQHNYKIDRGLNLFYDSTIPVGSSLSSSAALLDVTIFMLSNLFNLNISKKDIALLAKEVENNYLNLSCGIMDQAIIALGKKNNAMLLDCAKFEYNYIPLDLGKYSFVILNTNVERQLTESKYNERVSECTKALNIIKTKYNVSNLCELSPKYLNDIKLLLNDDILYKRVHHVVSEEARVQEFCTNLKDSNILRLASLLNESHKSLKEDYEVSGIYLDTIVEEAIKAQALGARMTGAGFSGCAIALIETSQFSDFKKSVEENYYNITNLKCDVILVDITDGVK